MNSLGFFFVLKTR